MEKVKKNKNGNKIKVYEEEWTPEMLTDDERVYRIKEALQELRPVERKIFLTYVEGGTYTSVAAEYGVSVPTAKKYLMVVIEKIKSMIKDKEEHDFEPTTD